jgi:hypothetical protein
MGAAAGSEVRLCMSPDRCGQDFPAVIPATTGKTTILGGKPSTPQQQAAATILGTVPGIEQNSRHRGRNPLPTITKPKGRDPT